MEPEGQVSFSQEKMNLDDGSSTGTNSIFTRFKIIPIKFP